MSDQRLELACIRVLYLFVPLFLLSWFVLAGFVPPPSPNASAHVIARQYQDNTTGIRAGMVIAIFSAALLLPWGGAVCSQLLRIEGRPSPLLMGWIAAQATVVIVFLFPCTFWLIAAFRPEDAARVQTFNDLGWLSFIGIVCTGMYQMVSLAVITLRDPRTDPVYPRWFAYFQLWCFFGVVPTAGVWFFKTGPLAWNGVLGFWLPVITYFTWVLVITVMTSRAIRHQQPERTPY